MLTFAQPKKTLSTKFTLQMFQNEALKRYMILRAKDVKPLLACTTDLAQSRPKVSIRCIVRLSTLLVKEFWPHAKWNAFSTAFIC